VSEQSAVRASLRTAAVQMRYSSAESVAARIERARALVAAAAPADLVVLPELWAHGGFSYGQWAEAAETLDGDVFTAVAELASNHRMWIHGGSIIEREQGARSTRLWNTSAVFDASGGCRAVYRKIHRFGFSDGEPRLLTAGADLVTLDLESEAGQGYRAGLSTCYDLRFPEQYRRLIDDGMEVCLVPAAWPLVRVGHWTALGLARAIENQAVLVQCNLAGTDGDVALGGSSRIVDANGDVLAAAGPHDETIVRAEVDLDALRKIRETFPVLADRRLT
jgi:predicted amidohydrolase